MTKKVVVRFLDENNTIHKLRYKLYDSDLANKWAAIIKKNQQRDNSYIHSFFMNQTEDNFPILIKEMNLIIAIINDQYDKQLPYFENEKFLNQDVLNFLHEEYEIYGDRIQQLVETGSFNGAVHDGFLRLNELIHDCELILKNSTRDFFSMSLLIDYYPQGIFESIQEIDKLYLQSAFRWGRLYLGYNTLGKDWLEISNHNDLDVIVRDQVRPQRRFSAESWFSFFDDASDLEHRVRFEKWYNSLPTDLKNKVPINNFNELTLGRFEIGTLIIDDYFLNFHKNKDDWILPKHTIKNKWNKEVFAKFRKTLDIEIR